MRILRIFLTALIFFCLASPVNATVRITNDRGGTILTYVLKYRKIRLFGESVVIDGLCVSACTIVLAAMPNDKLCVTPKAKLGFHAPWDFDEKGRLVTNSSAAEMLYFMYPERIQKWIDRHGGLTEQMIFLEGRELTQMYKQCPAGS